MRKGMGLILALSILLSGFFLAPAVDSLEDTVATKALTPHAPIRINNNTDLAAEAFSGNGTVWAPWVIENLEINGTGPGYCLYVGNTTEYFIIRNCSLFGANGPYLESYAMNSSILINNAANFIISNISANNSLVGIFLWEDARSGIIENSSIFDCDMGIRAEHADYLNVSSVEFNNCTNYSMLFRYTSINNVENCTVNNTGYCGIGVFWNGWFTRIMNNNISNSEVGVHLLSSSAAVVKNDIAGNLNGVAMGSASSIVAYHNNFWNNVNQSVDEGSNYWDGGYPLGGNYWSNYSGPDSFFGIDQNYTGPDGIVDAPYIIDGDSRDRYPLSAPYTGQFDGDMTPPHALNWLPVSDSTHPAESIWLVWNEAMNWTSVENGFSFTDGFTVWTSANGSWNHMPTNISEFDPAYPFEYGTTYWVQVNTTVTDAAGNRLDQNQNGAGGEPYDWLNFTFTTMVLDANPPQSVNHSPNGTDVPIDSAIQIGWNETMNWTSVEEAFSYTDGLNNWTSDDGLWDHYAATNISVFTPGFDFDYETQYFVTLNCTASDFAGNMLDQDGNGTGGYWPEDVLTWNFITTNEAPYVVSTVPANNQVDVDPGSQMKITFSEAMNWTSVEEAFSYTNGTETWAEEDGVVFWNVARTEFTFEPVTPLGLNQTFTAMLDGYVARDTGGKLLDGGNYSWNFRTWLEPPAPKVISTYPTSGAANVNVNTYITIAFDSRMDPQSVEDAFSYTDGHGVWDATNGTVDWFSENTMFSFQPTERLNFDSTYTVRIDTNASSVWGKLLDGNGNGISEVSDDFVFLFSTGPEFPVVVSHFPEDGAFNVPVWLPAIYINFSKPMNVNSVTNAISIYPPTNYVPSFSPDGKNLTILLNEDLDLASPYRVTIMSTAVDQFGIVLDGNDDGWSGDRFTFTFSTEGMDVPELPQITRIFPPNNYTIESLDAFFVIIEFNVEMNKTSVQNAFSFSNASSPVNGTFMWSSNGLSMRYTPTEVLEYNTTYIVKLMGTAKDLEGHMLGNATTWQYRTIAETPPTSIMSWLPYIAIAFLVIMTIMLYMANRSLRMELKKNRVMLKRAMRKGGFTESDLRKSERPPEANVKPAENTMPAPEEPPEPAEDVAEPVSPEPVERDGQ